MKNATRSHWCWAIIQLCLVIILGCSVPAANGSLASEPSIPLRPPCGPSDHKPLIGIDRCRPSSSRDVNGCNELVRLCKCQHDVELKWVGNSCPGFAGSGVGCYSSKAVSCRSLTKMQSLGMPVCQLLRPQVSEHVQQGSSQTLLVAEKYLHQ